MIHLLLDKDPWFRPKRIGYGATPSRWQGWALTGVYLAFIAGMALSYAREAIGRPTWWAVLVLATALFLWIVHRRTEGGWKWRGGGE